MNNRLLNHSPAPRTAFGLVAWLEQTKIILPLKGLECTFDVCGDVVSVEMDQIFHQNNAQPLDCLYSFPLPASAAIYRCEMHVNGRIIRAKVEERERARQLAREKKAAGHRTALVEMERDNLFTLSLGNVQPGDVVVIRFAYFQTLTRLGDWTSFHVPFCPGMRYVPGTPLLRAPRGRGAQDDTDEVPDASRISPPRIDRLHPNAAYLSVNGVLEQTASELKDISSPSHPMLVSPSAETVKVALADQGAVPDCDFVLRWTEAQPQQVKRSGWVSHSPSDTFALLRLCAPLQVAVSDVYAQDIYFLIDRSGSMQGLKWRKAVQAFHQFLQTLGKQDRVWATFFESQFRDFAEKPLPVHQMMADPAVRELESLGADGGTELLPALEHVLEKVGAHSTGRPAALVLITDGQIGNEAAVLDRLARHANLRVNVFGIDVAFNDGFLNKLAAQHHGASCLMAPQDDIAGAVARLGDRLRRPVLTSIRPPQGWELAGADLPGLHAGEILSLPLRLMPRQASETGQAIISGNLDKFSPRPTTTVTLEATLPDGVRQQYHFDLTETNSSAPRLLWMKRRIDLFLAKGQKEEAIALARESNLVCEGAAFIAWDETEKVAVSRPESELYQPSMALFDTTRVGTAGVIESLSFGAGSDLGRGEVAAGTAGVIESLSFGAGLVHKSFFSLSARRSARSDTSGKLGEYIGAFTTPRLTDWIMKYRKHCQKSTGSGGQDFTPLLSAFVNDSLFQTPAGIQLADWLVSWAISGPPGKLSDLVHLHELVDHLQKASGQSPAKRVKIILDWVNNRVPFDQRKKALVRLAGLQEELGLKTKTEGHVPAPQGPTQF